jgi:hypothetical protein
VCLSLRSVPNCLQTHMRHQEDKLRKVKEILNKDSCHIPVQPVSSATTLESNTILSRVLLAQNSRRVCTSS